MADNLENNKRIAKNSVFMSIRMVFLLVITLYSTRIILRILGVEDYGIYNLVYGFVSMFSFLNLSMSNGIQRFFNFELGKNGTIGACNVFNTALRIQIILAILVVVIIEAFGLWYLNNKMVLPADRLLSANIIFHCSIVSFVFIIIQAPFAAAVMAHEKMDFYAFAGIFTAIMNLAIAFIVPLFHYDNLKIYGILLCLVNFLTLLIYIYYCHRKFEEIILIKKENKQMFKSMLGFSGWNLFGSMSALLKEQGVNMIMNLFCGPVVNAARGVASQVSSGLQSFVNNIATPVRPQVIQSYAVGNIQRTMKLTYSISKLSCIFLYLISLPVMFEVDYILHIWLGDNIPPHTSSFVILVISTNFVNNLNAAISGVVHASGKMKNYQIVGAIVNLLSLPLAYLSMKYGASPECALVIILIVTVANQFACLFVLKTIIDFSIKEYFNTIIIPFLAVIISTIWVPFLINFNMREGIWRVLLNFSISIVIVSFVAYFIGLNYDEKKLIKGMAISAVNKIKR